VQINFELNFLIKEKFDGFTSVVFNLSNRISFCEATWKLRNLGPKSPFFGDMHKHGVGHCCFDE